jgi:hypothetical protein
MCVRADIALADVITPDDDNVGFFGLRIGCAG